MNLRPIFEKLYPTGSIGGQCFEFCHKLVKQTATFPGMPIFGYQKEALLKTAGIPINQVDALRVGDVLLLNYGLYDHGAIVNAILPGGKLQLTESNYNEILKPLRVNHSRTINFNDPAILGVFRSDPLYSLPPFNYPIQPKVLLVMNMPMPWNSLLQVMAQLQTWIFTTSGQRIEPIVNYKMANFSNWETVFTGPGIGGTNMEIIKESWFDANIIPYAQAIDIHNTGRGDFDIIIFVMPRSQWTGTVFDNPNAIELGYTYEYVPKDPSLRQKQPMKIMCVADEHDDFAPFYPGLSGLAKLAAHEMSHGLYGWCLDLQNKHQLVNGNWIQYAAGTDNTHRFFLGSLGETPAPQKVFNEFDYYELNSVLNP